MVKSDSKSYAELAVEHLVRASSKRRSPGLFTFSFVNEGITEYHLMKWSAKKARGVLPSVLPRSGETISLHSTTLQPRVKWLAARRSGIFLAWHERMTPPSLLFFSGAEQAISVSPSAASYTYVTVAPCCMPLVPRNDKYFITLFQKKMVDWCFFFFHKNMKSNEISEKRLIYRFPALLGFTIVERRACIEEAMELFSMNMLIVFNTSILLRARTKCLPFTSLLSPEEMIVEEALERSLTNCWMSCRRPVTEILDALGVLSRKIQKGYHVKSSLILESLALVLGVVAFAVYPTTKAAQLMDYFNAFLFFKMNPFICGDLISAFRQKSFRILENSPEMEVFLTAALQNPFCSVHGSENDHSLNIYSLFTQAPEEDPPTSGASPSILRIDLTYKVEHCHIPPGPKARKISSELNDYFLLTQNNFEEFSSCFAAKNTDGGSLSFDLRSIRKERCGEEEALAIIRSRKRRLSS